MPKKKSKPALPVQAPISNAVNDEPEISSSTEENLAESYELELCWCIQQLELSINNAKTVSKQIEEKQSILKTLQSDKAPIVKKRMLMRKAFGDYRKLMNEERIKIEKEIQKITVAPAEAPPKSIYIKKVDPKLKDSKPIESTPFLFNFSNPD